MNADVLSSRSRWGDDRDRGTVSAVGFELSGRVRELAHDHPDFRVRGGRVFATLSLGEKSGMVKLIPEQQEEFVQAEPKVFEPVKGGWGRGGATSVRLKSATKAILRPAMAAAWCNAAPKKLARQFEASLK